MGEPLILFQETWRRQPFWMLVGCVLVNRTRWTQAEPVHRRLRKLWPTPEKLANAGWRSVMVEVHGLGLGERRAKNLVLLAGVWEVLRRIRVKPSSSMIKNFPGCGKYAADSWSMFIDCVDPGGVTDKKLRGYLQHHCLRYRPRSEAC